MFNKQARILAVFSHYTTSYPCNQQHINPSTPVAVHGTQTSRSSRQSRQSLHRSHLHTSAEAASPHLCHKRKSNPEAEARLLRAAPVGGIAGEGAVMSSSAPPTAAAATCANRSIRCDRAGGSAGEQRRWRQSSASGGGGGGGGGWGDEVK